MKILITFDSFKGSLSSKLAGNTLAKGILRSGLKTSVEVISVADGGEGSLEMIKADKTGHNLKVLNPLGKETNAYFLSSGDTAYIEMAISTGLTLLKKEEQNPLKTSTFGLGQVIKHALNSGSKKVVIFAGGSATNDAGLGALSALGFKFWDEQNNLIVPNGGNLRDIVRFDFPSCKIRPNILVATDVTNPFHGSQGATYIYGPQKGATAEMLEVLEEGLVNIASLFTDVSINQIAGSGAAGGLAGGLHLFLGAKVVSATDILFKEIDLASKVKEADIVITGEGRIDGQSLNGKLISKILELSNDHKFILISGDAENGLNFSKTIYSSTLKNPKQSTEYSIKHAEDLMLKKGVEVGEFLKNKLG